MVVTFPKRPFSSRRRKELNLTAASSHLAFRGLFLFSRFRDDFLNRAQETTMLRMLSIPKTYHRWWMFFAAFILGLLIQNVIFAQSNRHQLTNGNLPPGKASELALRSNPELFGHIQPVKIVTPQNALVSFWDGGGYATANFQGPTFGMTMGPVYRLKITNIPGHSGLEIFPSVELLSRLHPPAGKELEFPIPVEITQDDLDQAIAGKMVTKVVYLEDPETALPFQQIGERQRNTDISGYEDTLHTADRLGRPMAIVRLGSRQPLATDFAGAFEFFGPPLQIMGAGNVGGVIEVMPEIIPSIIPEQTRNALPKIGFPPIVSGSEKASYTIGDK